MSTPQSVESNFITRTLDPAPSTKHASSTSHESVDPDLTPGGFAFDVALSTAVASNGAVREPAPDLQGPLTPQTLDKMHRYWRAANYLCIGQIYLFENPLYANLSMRNR